MSLPTRGDYSCADLQIILSKAEEIFTDDIRKSEYIAHVESAKAVIENQTARFNVLQDPEKDREVKVWWVDDCDTEDPTDCTDECEINGDEAGANCVNYALDECFQKEYKTTRKQYRDVGVSLEETVAIQLLKKMKLMDEYIAKRVIQFLDFNSGVNQYEGEFTNSGGNITLIPPAAWNEDIFGYLTAAGQINELGSMKLLSGVNLSRLIWKLNAESGNANGAGGKAKMMGFDNPYLDLFKLDQTVGAKTTFLFNPNSVAVVTKTYNDGVARTHQNPYQIATTIDSFNLPGIKYDWFYMPKCESNDWTDAWRLQAKMGIFLNPIGCNSEKTGIIQLQCGTA